MKKLLLSTIIFVATAATSFSAQKATLPDSTLRQYAAKMLMVGFKGDSVTDSSDAARYVRDLKVGGIILFDVDLTGTAKIGSRNITSKERLTKMTADLQRYAGGNLLIAIDQEGGMVRRLRPEYGYSQTVSQEYLGKINSRDTTMKYAGRMAKEIKESGVNVNLAPLIDVNVNPECPVIGALHRSYSSDTAIVSNNAKWSIEAHHRNGVLCAVKHFPGHGSSASDSHYGLTDVTDTWQSYELAPFRELISSGKVDMVMTAHIFQRNLDPEYPATLSKKIIDGVLRKQLGFEGVVLTDDMYMQGIIDNYKVEDAIVLAINAGADILVMGNNISTGYEPERPFHIVDMIVRAVKEGRIDQQRLIESNRRIDSLIDKLKH
ncbi:MAG: glycoside hydrolase family 3 protein [Bacteroidetes bacterium]|uniref:Glycoside hydrolase family 3 protein n=1 Tax=Candidatus Limisoma faecipullorum TaxID=2840854 RepID=A0A9D9IMB8_9BACT|nr:glycoside hydrolase family 3 protein [Candidatus Limisoma faecipullorum]